MHTAENVEDVKGRTLTAVQFEYSTKLKGNGDRIRPYDARNLTTCNNSGNTLLVAIFVNRFLSPLKANRHRTHNGIDDHSDGFCVHVQVQVAGFMQG